MINSNRGRILLIPFAIYYRIRRLKITISPTVFWMLTLAEECRAISIESIHRWKGYFSGLQFCHLQYGSTFINSFSRCRHRNPRNYMKFKLFALEIIQGHRPWCQSKAHTPLVPFSRFWCINLEDGLFSPPHPIWHPAQVEPVRISGRNLFRKFHKIYTVRWKLHDPIPQPF